MPNLTITIPIELKKKIDSLPELNWSETIRSFLAEKVKRALILKKLDNLLAKSELTEEDCLVLGERMKGALLKRYTTHGAHY